jgi:hypothetical protein
MIRLVTAPYFLATKIEAFKGRGRGDYLTSHDLEDIIIVLDGRPEIVTEIKNSSADLIKFLSNSFQNFLTTEGFLEAIPGHLLLDPAFFLFYIVPTKKENLIKERIGNLSK